MTVRQASFKRCNLLGLGPSTGKTCVKSLTQHRRVEEQCALNQGLLNVLIKCP